MAKFNKKVGTTLKCFERAAECAPKDVENTHVVTKEYNDAAKVSLDNFLKTIREFEGIQLYASEAPRFATGDVSFMRVCKSTVKGETSDAVLIEYKKPILVDGELIFSEPTYETIRCYVGIKN